MTSLNTMRSQDEIISEWQPSSVSSPLISICCITFNHEGFIKDALNGFLSQKTSFPFEILIHDDASTDNTAKIIREYEKQYPLIIKPIYQTKNQFTQGKKINPEFNYPRAKGDFIALCEGDDFWTDSNKLERQVKFLQENAEFSMSCHAVDVLDNTAEAATYTPYYLWPKTVSTFEDVLFEHFIPTLSIVFRKSCMPIPLPVFSKNVFSMDKAQALILTSQGLCHFDVEKMGCYRHHDGGITKNKKRNIELFREREYCLYQELAEYLSSMPYTLFRRRLGRVDYTVAMMYRKEKKYYSMIYFFTLMLCKDITIPIKMMHRKIRR